MCVQKNVLHYVLVAAKKSLMSSKLFEKAHAVVLGNCFEPCIHFYCIFVWLYLLNKFVGKHSNFKAICFNLGKLARIHAL